MESCRDRVDLLIVTPGASLEAEPDPCSKVHVLALPPAGGGLDGLRRDVERLKPGRVVVAVDPSRPEAAVYAVLAAAAVAGTRRVAVRGEGEAARLARKALEERGQEAAKARSDDELLDLAAQVLEEMAPRRSIRHLGLLAPVASMLALTASLFAVFTLAMGFPLDIILEALGMHSAAELVSDLSPSGVIARVFDQAAGLAAERLGGWMGDAAVGVLSGVGIVASLAPVIILATVAVAVLEDSGLLARIILGLQPLLRPLGFPSQALYPLLLSTGCNVPGVLSGKSLPREARVAVAVAAPLVPCSARLAVIAVFSFAIMPDPLSQALSAAGVYIIALLFAGATAALVYRLQGGPRLTAVVEPPPLRPPRARHVYRVAGEAVRELLIKMAGPIVVAAALLWLLAGGGHASSVGEELGRAVGRVFYLIGVDPDTVETLGVAAIAGATVKEVILEAIAVRAGTPDPWQATATLHLTAPQAVAILVFFTLYTPCIATAAAILTTTGSPRILALTTLYTLTLATTAMTLVYYVLEVIGIG